MNELFVIISDWVLFGTEIQEHIVIDVAEITPLTLSVIHDAFDLVRRKSYILSRLRVSFNVILLKTMLKISLMTDWTCFSWILVPIYHFKITESYIWER